MVLAAKFSKRLGWISQREVDETIELIAAANLPTQLPKELSADKMLELMSIDKKVKEGKLYLVLLNGIGDAVLTSDYDHGLLREMLADIHASL